MRQSCTREGITEHGHSGPPAGHATARQEARAHYGAPDPGEGALRRPLLPQGTVPGNLPYPDYFWHVAVPGHQQPRSLAGPRRPAQSRGHRPQARVVLYVPLSVAEILLRTLGAGGHGGDSHYSGFAPAAAALVRPQLGAVR